MSRRGATSSRKWWPCVGFEFSGRACSSLGGGMAKGARGVWRRIIVAVVFVVTRSDGSEFFVQGQFYGKHGSEHVRLFIICDRLFRVLLLTMLVLGSFGFSSDRRLDCSLVLSCSIVCSRLGRRFLRFWLVGTIDGLARATITADSTCVVSCTVNGSCLNNEPRSVGCVLRRQLYGFRLPHLLACSQKRSIFFRTSCVGDVNQSEASSPSPLFLPPLNILSRGRSDPLCD